MPLKQAQINGVTDWEESEREENDEERRNKQILASVVPKHREETAPFFCSTV
jgi:hypothetical protein